MKHLSHLVRADVRRFRLVLALWVLIQIGDTVFRGVRPTLGTDPTLLTAVDLLATVLFLIRWLGMVVIVPLVVQTHPLAGSDAFWMTRPIPWRALFASKVVLLGSALVAVPALCELVLMLASRVPARQVPLVTLQTILFQSLWLFIVMALSAITRNLARFALAAGGVLVALVLLINVAIAVMVRNLPDAPQLTLVASRAVASPAAGAVMLILPILAAVTLLVVQYRTRSTRLSVGAGLTSVAIAFLIVLVWPSQGRQLPIPEWARQDSALQLIAESRHGEFRAIEGRLPLGRSGGWQMGSVRIRLRGVEENWLATLRLAGSTVRLDDGTALTTVGNGYSSTVPFESVDDDQRRFVMRQLLDVGRLLDGSRNRFVADAAPAIVMTQADFRTHAGATGMYRGRFLVDLDQVEIAAALPLEAGAEFQDRRRRIVIDQVIPQDQGASIRLRQFTSASMFDADDTPQVSFYLRNREAAEAVAGSAHYGAGMSTSFGLPFLAGVSVGTAGPGSGFAVTGNVIRFPEAYGTDEQMIDIGADWLSRAELVIVYTVSAGSVSRTLEIPGFEIGPAATTAR